MFVPPTIFALLGLVFTACAARPPPPGLADGPRTEVIYAVTRGWHTDVAISADAIGDRLEPLRSVFPGVRFLVFGFGDRAYLLAAHPGLGEMLAALLPHPAALLVTALRDAPDDAFHHPSEVMPLHISKAGLARLAGYIADSFEFGPDGLPRLLANGPYPGSVFYYSSQSYSGVFTCNTWTAEALQSSGLPIRADGVLFAGGVVEQARRAAE